MSTEPEQLTLGDIAARGVDQVQDPTASKWFKTALWAAFSCDPVDAANDAEALAKFLAWRADAMAAAFRPNRDAPR